MELQKLFAAVVILCAFDRAALAQQVVFGDSYDNEMAKFIHSTSQSVRWANQDLSRHVVCNRHDSKGLIFTWTPPGFGSGLDCPLAVNQCAILERDAVGELEESDSSIGFIQDDDGSHSVVALVDTESSSYNGGWLGSRFLTFLSGPPQCAPRVLEINSWAILQQDSKDVAIDISWHPPGVRIAYGIDRSRYSDEQIESIIEALSETDSEASEQSVQDVISEEALSWLGDDFSISAVIVFQTPEDGNNTASIRFPTEGEVQSVTVPVFFLSGETLLAAALFDGLAP